MAISTFGFGGVQEKTLREVPQNWCSSRHRCATKNSLYKVGVLFLFLFQAGDISISPANA